MSHSTNPKLVFQDIDGCLNPISGEDFPPGGVGLLSDEQADMLKRLGQAMDASSLDHIVINTGRNTEDTTYIQKALRSKKARYAILEHSAYAWDYEKNSKVDLADLAKLQQRQDMSERYAVLPKIKDLIHWYRKDGRDWLLKKGIHARDCINKEANLSIAIPEGQNGQSMIDHLKEALSEVYPPDFFKQLHFCYSNFFVDVIGPILKSDGAYVMAEHLSIQQEDCFVIGDSLNDIDLFEAFPERGLCPGNAHNTIKELCSKLNHEISDLTFGEACLKFYRSLALQ